LQPVPGWRRGSVHGLVPHDGSRLGRVATAPPSSAATTTTPAKPSCTTARGGETPLQWGGALAERLGLVGAVDDAGYDAIYGPGGARYPHLGTRLAKTKRPGVELVVAAHKTVAVLGLIGRVEDMHAILDAETDATLGFLD
jgi:hypothetical protein